MWKPKKNGEEEFTVKRRYKACRVCVCYNCPSESCSCQFDYHPEEHCPCGYCVKSSPNGATVIRDTRDEVREYHKKNGRNRW